jgi:cyclic pyranopterin monophosphate synthase
MIDITDKKIVKRTAVVEGVINLKESTIQKIKEKTTKKGDVLEIARVAGINAVKQTQNLIPMCHQIPIEKVNITYTIDSNLIKVNCEVKTTAKTGVEMESLVGATITLNTIWDMVKYLEKDEEGQYKNTTITNIRVIKKEKGE